MLILLAFILAATPPATDHPLKRGETLESVAKASYGSKAFAPLLAKFNELPPNAKPKSLKVPTLAKGLHDVGLTTEIEGVCVHLANVSETVTASQNSRAPKATGFSTPELVQLRNAQSALDQGISALEAARERWTPPQKAIAELKDARIALQQIVEGKSGDFDGFYGHIVAALLEIIRWDHAGYR